MSLETQRKLILFGISFMIIFNGIIIPSLPVQWKEAATIIVMAIGFLAVSFDAIDRVAKRMKR